MGFHYLCKNENMFEEPQDDFQYVSVENFDCVFCWEEFGLRNKAVTIRTDWTRFEAIPLCEKHSKDWPEFWVDRN